jgi:hypothetical protein
MSADATGTLVREGLIVDEALMIALAMVVLDVL